MKGLFVTGTDTGIGKTYCTVALIKALQDAGIKTTAMKPVASGCDVIAGQLRNDDALAIQAALVDDVAYELINPYSFAPAISPHLAAAQAGVEIDFDVIKAAYETLVEEKEFVLVEGVGGWLAPISDESSVADLARIFDLPIVLVVGMRLGCLNHSVLTAQSIRQAGFKLAGWIANCVDPDLAYIDEQLDYLSKKLQCAPMAVLAYGAQLPASIDVVQLLR